MFGRRSILKEHIDYSVLLIKAFLRSARKESVNPAVVVSEYSAQKLEDNNAVIPSDESSYGVVKDESFRYPKPDVESSKSPPGIFAFYINKSPLLQALFRLGVNFHKIEDNSEATQFLLRCNFESVRDHITFLNELSIEPPNIGKILTKNPFILKENLDDLQVRVNYLKYKKFDDATIARIVVENPQWLTHSTQKIDEKLGFFQKSFELTGNEVRFLVARHPKVITFSMASLKVNLFTLKEELGFTTEELKKIILNKPKILMSQKRTIEAFDYAHNTMKLPIERLVDEPEILTCRMTRLRSRHLFLEKLGRAQYDPKKPNYVSLKALISGDDAQFCMETAKASVDMYNTFLKTV